MQIFDDVKDCTRCKLHTGRTNIVFGTGNPQAKIMFVGEAPGHDEDLAGVPFVGQAGQLLTALMARAGISREDVYIANILKCRPPGNRDPEPDEILACYPFLQRQISVVKPKVLVGLGRYASCRLVYQWCPMGTLLAKDNLVYPDGNIPVIPIYHPSYLLRNGREKTPRSKELFLDFCNRLQKAKEISMT